MPVFGPIDSFYQLYRWGYSTGPLYDVNQSQGPNLNLPFLELRDERSPLKRTPRGTWRNPTPYHRVVESGYLFGPAISWSAKWLSGGGSYRNYEEGSGKPTSSTVGNRLHETIGPPPAWLRASAEIKALQRLKAQKVNFGVALGERAETAELVATTLHRVVGAVRAAKRLDPKAMLRALKLDTSRVGSLRRIKKPFELWLEAQYGWMPLLSDVHGAMTVLKEKDSADPTRYVVSCNANVMSRWYDNRVHTKAWLGYRQFYDVRREAKVLDRARVSLDFYLDNPYLAEAASLGLTNPLEVAWELLPFSFVADWFLPVGDYLSILDATLGYVLKGGTVTESRRVQGKWYAENPVLEEVSRSVSGDHYYQFFMNRSVYEDVPWPDLLTLFSGGGLTGYRLNNAISLAATNLGKLRRLF